MKRHVSFEYYDLGTEQDLEFKGLAYSGAVVEHMLGMEIVDVASMQVFSKTDDLKVPIFSGHDTNQEIGHGFVKIEDGKVWLDRGLLYGELGEKKFGNMKKGFPYELSIGFEASPDDVRQLQYGEYETVNGVEVTYPMTIWRNVQLNEISLVAFGADRNSEAKVYRAMKNYKPKKEKKMAKKEKIKGFYECSCEEQKEQGKKLIDQVKGMKDKRKEDEELYSLLSQMESVLSGLDGLVDSKYELETKTAEFAKVEETYSKEVKELASLKEEHSQALLKLEEYTAKEDQRILDEKKSKLHESFKKIGKAVTDEVEAEFLSMTEKQFSVALEAMQTQGKSYLYNPQYTGEAGDADMKKLQTEAKRIREQDGIKDVLVSYQMAKKNLGL